MNNALEKSGLVELINKVLRNNDIYMADVLYYGKLARNKMFFPSHWSREKVMSKIVEAYDNFIVNGAKNYIEEGGKFIIKGCISEGITIEMYITKNGELLTAYPLYEI